MKIQLTASYKVTEVKKRTQAKFFKELKVGDVFTLTYDLNGHYKSAPTIKLSADGKAPQYNSSLQLSNNLINFELEEVTT